MARLYAATGDGIARLDEVGDAWTARIYRRRDGAPWQPLSGGLPEPLPAMPYALLAADGRLFAGLANGQLWASPDQGDSWSPVRITGGTLDALLALGSAMH